MSEEELQRMGVEAVFETLTFKKRFDEYVKLLEEGNKKTAQAAQKMSSSMAKADEEIGASWHKLATAALEQGSSIKDVAEYFGITRAEVLEFAKSSDQASTAAFQSAIAIEEQAQAVKKSGQATRSAASYITRYLQRMALWLTVGAAVRGIVNGITRTLSENIRRLYENTDEWKNYQAQLDKVGLALTAALVPASELEGVLGKGATAADWMADSIANMGAEMWASIAVMRDYVAMTGEWLDALKSGDLDRAAAIADKIDSWQTGTAGVEEFQRKREEYLRGTAEAMDMAGEEAIDLARAEEELAKILMDTDAELERHAQAISLIHGAYDDKASQIVIDFWEENERITQEMTAEIEKINQDALERTAKITTKGNQRIRALKERARRDEENDEKRHQLEMEFRRKRYELTSLQNERLYQARRRRLVGEGDTLGIEQLDEDYELQRQAAQENFDLQMQQAEAMYKLQAKIQEESMASQIALLRQAMQEQIAEVEAARRRQVEEAEAAAAAELAVEEAKRDQLLIDAKKDRDQQLQDEADAHKKRMEALAVQIVDFVKKYDLKFNMMDAVVEKHFGKGSVMDKAVEQAFQRMQEYAAQAAAYMNTVLNNVTYSGGGGRFGINYPGYSRGAGKQAGTAGGRSEVYSKPTLVPVAEGRAERLSVQPLYNTGSPAMSISWSGQPIPVRGEGSLSGADLSELGSSITIAIMSKMQQSYRDMHTPAG